MPELMIVTFEDLGKDWVICNQYPAVGDYALMIESELLLGIMRVSSLRYEDNAPYLMNGVLCEVFRADYFGQSALQGATTRWYMTDTNWRKLIARKK